jgi:hypothetical protein
MSTTVESQTVQFSELSRNSKEVAEATERGPVRITRRDGESLILVKASDVERARVGQQLAAQIVSAAVGSWPASFADRLRAPFPWIEFLSPEHREAFAQEVVNVARACASVATFGRLEITIDAWRATAQAYAEGVDPTGADLASLDEPESVPDPRD